MSCLVLVQFQNKNLIISEIKCEPLYVSNGRVNCTESNMYKSICDITCVDGYYLAESSKNKKTRCELNGSWNKNAPICLPNRCPVEMVEKVLNDLFIIYLFNLLFLKKPLFSAFANIFCFFIVTFFGLEKYLKPKKVYLKKGTLLLSLFFFFLVCFTVLNFV